MKQHEMLHWFHALRDMNRQETERSIDSEIVKEADFLFKISLEPEKKELWYGRKEKNNPESNLVVRMEEFRTIMGYKIKIQKKGSDEVLYDMQEPINGDDLCENLYRRCVGQKLRYGHSTKPNQTLLKKVADHMRTTYENQLNSGGYKFVKS